MMNQQSEGSNGLVAAAMLAAGIGCLFLGVMTSLSEGIHPVENALNFYNPVGALTGKTLDSHCALVGLLGHTRREMAEPVGRLWENL